MSKRPSLVFCLFIAGLAAKAQVPDTDLWLFKIDKDKTNTSILKDPLNITNRPGYDNQPSFSADGKKIYYVSIREDKQADIYAYELSSKKNLPFTNSRISEYSPTLIEAGKYMACVTVEADSAQRIHFINTFSGVDEKSIETDSIGYFTFLNADTLIYYKLTEPHSLRYQVPGSGEDKWIANSPVRTFRAINRHKLIYGIKDSVKVVFYTYDFLLQRAHKYAEYPSTNEDILWHASWGLLKSEENRLLRFDSAAGQWVLLYDLASFGIKKITRFVFDPKNKYLVVVNNL